MKNRSTIAVLACTVACVGAVVAYAQSTTTSNSNSQSTSGSGTASSSGSSRASASGGSSAGGSLSGGQMGIGNGSGSGSGSGSGNGSMRSLNRTVWVIEWKEAKAPEAAANANEIEIKHEKWVKEHFYRRGIVMEGFFEQSGGRMALVSGLEENANWVAEESPLVKSGLATAEVREWNVTHSIVGIANQTGSSIRPAASARDGN